MKCVFALSGLLVLNVSAGVYDDAVAWWHLDYAPGLATNNVAQLTDIRDQRAWGTTASPHGNGRNATAIGGEDGGPLWTNAPVVCPAGGQAYPLSLHFRQITNSVGQLCPDAIKFENLRLGGSCTIVTRFLWDGRYFSDSHPDWIYNNSLGWNERTGWMFGVRHDEGGHRLGLYVAQERIYSDTTVTSNIWYDAAAVLTDNGPGNNDIIELYFWGEGGNLQYTRRTTFAITNGVANTGGSMGSEAYPSTNYATPTSGNAGKSFKGLVNHLALWDRALTYNEVLEALTFPAPVLQVGINGNGTNDLRPENETDPVYTLGDPWHTFPRALTHTRRTITLNIPLTASQTTFNQILHLKTHDAHGGVANSIKALLTVNGHTNPRRDTQRLRPFSDYYWPIPSNHLVTGNNTLVLTYVAGPAEWLTFDSVTLGSGWQVGKEDNTSGEFIQESAVFDHYYITDPDWKHVERAVTFANTNTFIHFPLSASITSNATYTYTTRIVSQGAGNTTTPPQPPYPFSININDEPLYSSASGVTNGTYLNLPLPRAALRPGMNEINLMFNATNGWLQFDFHRLQSDHWILPDRTPTTLTIQ